MPGAERERRGGGKLLPDAVTAALAAALLRHWSLVSYQG
jgi:hypothetical protein